MSNSATAEIIPLNEAFFEADCFKDDVRHSSLEEDLIMALTCDDPHSVINGYGGFGHTEIPAIPHRNQSAGYGICGISTEQMAVLHQQVIRSSSNIRSEQDIQKALLGLSFQLALKNEAKGDIKKLPAVYQQAIETAPFGSCIIREIEFKSF